MTTFSATYSPEDNKLRLYASSRLDRELYERVKNAGYKWAPKQELFVAPAWTPSREDLALELAGEIDDEDKSLVERAEDRADRFGDYQENRTKDADRAHAAVHAIADNIPLGQPILIGHHSERHARRDAEKIENGMRKAIKMWDTAQYWKQRAAGALHHAKYKELPAVRARRIKGLESDQRKHQKNRDNSAHNLRLWEAAHDDELTTLKRKDGPSTFLERARYLANRDSVPVVPQENQNGSYVSYWSAWDVLRPDGERYTACPAVSPEVVQAKAISHNRDYIAMLDRWLTHYANRLLYERAMMEESGGLESDKTAPEIGGGCQCWVSPRGGWSYIVKVNRTTVTVLDKPPYGENLYRKNMPFDKLRAVMSKAQVEEKRAAGLLIETQYKDGFQLLDTPRDPPRTAPAPEPEGEKFDALRQTLKAGVKVFSAPQLFPTPADLARRMVEIADIQPGMRVLEPSAGTGNILAALPNVRPGGQVVAVEISVNLSNLLREIADEVHNEDFLECKNLGEFDRIVMNPPFIQGADIKHIKHAASMLAPDGYLVAICAGGPNQKRELEPMAELWEPLPAETFKDSGTMVNTVLLTIRAQPAWRTFELES
jgi:phospholipid N-methyltransferase